MFVSATAVIIFSGIQLPILSIPLIGNFISNSILIYPFFIISVVIFMNGVNMIDGSNGLMPMTALGQLASLIFLSNAVEDYQLINFLLLLSLPLIIFTFFNYPFGKIFMGDLGAYVYGFFIAIMTITFFGRNPVLPSWGAVLILFYPLMEIFFSYYRKIFYDKISPLYPDSYHIHLKMYHLLSYKIKKRRIANGLVMPTLSILWLSPCILITWFYDSLLGILISLVVLIVAYLGFYWSLPRN
jgi:UDP-N-acetylmuramyl pentapeptide phosphotransferase/UDP-N-acetylglucosamine-1-phosphate transferase